VFYITIRLFLAVGLKPNIELSQKIGGETDDKGYIVTDNSKEQMLKEFLQ